MKRKRTIILCIFMANIFITKGISLIKNGHDIINYILTVVSFILFFWLLSDLKKH